MPLPDGTSLPPPAGDPHGPVWVLDPAVTFLNHGSFGACPREVLEAQARWRDRMEAEPVAFLARDLDEFLAEARVELARFLGAAPDDLAFVPNATAGVNTVLRSLRFAPGDELLALDHAYNASLNALRFAAARDGARVVVARVPFPLEDAGAVVDAVCRAVNPRTRLALVDHVTSPTGLVLPVARIVAELATRGIDTLVDGAHAPGMVPLDLPGLGAAYYTGNCHKWLCAPKGSAFLHVRRDRQQQIRPLAISHGANSARSDTSRYRLEFDWTGTFDPTPWLCIPHALRVVPTGVPGGWAGLMAANRRLALEARDLLAHVLGVEHAAPDAMIGAMAAIRLPGTRRLVRDLAAAAARLEAAIVARGFEAPIVAWPPPWLVASGDLAPSAAGDLYVRVSAQRYNRIEQYERLADVLREILAAATEGA